MCLYQSFRVSRSDHTCVMFKTRSGVVYQNWRDVYVQYIQAVHSPFDVNAPTAILNRNVAIKWIKVHVTAQDANQSGVVELHLIGPNGGSCNTCSAVSQDVTTIFLRGDRRMDMQNGSSATVYARIKTSVDIMAIVEVCWLVTLL